VIANKLILSGVCIRRPKNMAFHRNALQLLKMIDPELLLQGYRLGVFPMAMEDDSIEWFSPDPRAILPLEDFHVTHALRRLLRRRLFETTINKVFAEVITACAKSSRAIHNCISSVMHIQSKLGKKASSSAAFTVSRWAALSLANRCFIA